MRKQTDSVDDEAEPALVTAFARAAAQVERAPHDADIVDLGRDGVHPVRGRCDQDFFLCGDDAHAHDQVDHLV